MKTRLYPLGTAVVLLLSVLFSAACGQKGQVMVLETEAASREGGEELLPETEMEAEGLESETDPGEETQLETCVWLYVHVCGAVEIPGVYELSEGSRICDAVEAAGGFLEEAAEDALNLAQPVTDGMKVEIPTKEEAELAEQVARESGQWTPEWAAVPSGDAGSGGGEDPKININTATAQELTALNGIGDSRAADIVAYREANGPFGSIEDLQKVPGIKDATFQKIKDDITVS